METIKEQLCGNWVGIPSECPDCRTLVFYNLLVLGTISYYTLLKDIVYLNISFL